MVRLPGMVWFARNNLHNSQTGGFDHADFDHCIGASGNGGLSYHRAGCRRMRRGRVRLPLRLEGLICLSVSWGYRLEIFRWEILDDLPAALNPDRSGQPPIKPQRPENAPGRCGRISFCFRCPAPQPCSMCITYRSPLASVMSTSTGTPSEFDATNSICSIASPG